MSEQLAAYDLSIIVPIYNVERYLEECLQSLADQTADNYEVVMVDDGSTDLSGEIAQSFSNSKSNFSYYVKPNGGLGSARNFGIKHARGKWLTFCDSDDVIPNDAYAKMLRLGEKDCSDVVVGNVVRFNSKRVWPSSLHSGVFTRAEECTTISKSPNILYDTISCNKLYRKSFWDSLGVAFPEGVLYEDIPVVIPLLCSASRVSLTSDVVYRWRAREGSDRSITQDRSNYRNLKDRLRALKNVDTFFSSRDFADDVRSIKEWKWLNLDLPLYIDACIDADESYFELLQPYASSVYLSADSENIAKLSVPKKMKYEALCMNDLPLLRKVINYGRYGYKFDKLIHENVGGVDTYKLRAPSRFTSLFSESTFDTTKNLTAFRPVCTVQSVEWSGTLLTVQGFCFFPKVSCPSPRTRTIEAALCDNFTGESIPLRAENTRAIGVRGRRELVFGFDDTGKRRLSFFNYRWSGFRFSVDFSDKRARELASHEAHFEITVRQGSLSSTFEVCGKTKLTTVVPTKIFSFGHVRTHFNPMSSLRVRFNERPSLVSAVSLTEGGDIAIALENSGSDPELSTEVGDKVRLCFDNDGVRILSSDVVGLGKGVHLLRCNGTELYCDHPMMSDLYYGPSGCWRALAWEDMQFAVEVFPLSPKISLASGAGTRVRVSGPKELMKPYSQGYMIAASDSMDIGALFRVDGVDFCNDDMILFFDLQSPVSDNNLYAEDWQLYLTTSDKLLSSKTIKTRIIGNHVDPVDLNLCADHIVQIATGEDGTALLRSKQRWGRLESTQARRGFIGTYLYPLFRLLPIDDRKIVFEGLWGRKYYCNPRSLYEFIDAYHPEFRCIWSLVDERIRIQGGGTPVRRLSLMYYYHMATAKYFVNNVNFHESFCKRPGQVYIETMHGMPLKTIGLDAVGEFNTQKKIDEYKKKCSLWDYVVVQNPEVETIARRCYAFDGTFLETGYPRNDIMFAENGVKERVRDALGIPPEKKIILYAPTWRSEDFFDFHFDVSRLREKLSRDYVMLLRVHPLAAKGLDTTLIDNRFIYNATSYPSTEELFIASDVVITDYSSLMFDYAILGKPIVFYAYDLESYRDRLRGLYYDLEEIAPGPIVKTQEALCDVLLDYSGLYDLCRETTARFRDRFCRFENGEASKRIFEQAIQR